MIDDVFHLVQVAIRVDPHNGPAKALDTQFGVESFGPVVSNIGKVIPSLETQATKSKGKIPHVLVITLPCDRLPDAEFLLANGHLPVTVLQGIFS
jgi:hypothetical protein